MNTNLSSPVTMGLITLTPDYFGTCCCNLTKDVALNFVNQAPCKASAKRVLLGYVVNRVFRTNGAADRAIGVCGRHYNQLIHGSGVATVYFTNVDLNKENIMNIEYVCSQAHFDKIEENLSGSGLEYEDGEIVIDPTKPCIYPHGCQSHIDYERENNTMDIFAEVADTFAFANSKEDNMKKCIKCKATTDHWVVSYWSGDVAHVICTDCLTNQKENNMTTNTCPVCTGDNVRMFTEDQENWCQEHITLNETEDIIVPANKENNAMDNGPSWVKLDEDIVNILDRLDDTAAHHAVLRHIDNERENNTMNNEDKKANTKAIFESNGGHIHIVCKDLIDAETPIPFVTCDEAYLECIHFTPDTDIIVDLNDVTMVTDNDAFIAQMRALISQKEANTDVHPKDLCTFCQACVGTIRDYRGNRCCDGCYEEVVGEPYNPVVDPKCSICGENYYEVKEVKGVLKCDACAYHTDCDCVDCVPVKPKGWFNCGHCKKWHASAAEVAACGGVVRRDKNTWMADQMAKSSNVRKINNPYAGR